jgi:hypothetical protein
VRLDPGHHGVIIVLIGESDVALVRRLKDSYREFLEARAPSLVIVQKKPRKLR